MEDGLKSISDMDGYEFYIPDYQRGYRWTNQHVENLLDDLKNHVLQGKGPFFLEPLVVSKIEGKRFELIDGQQRLTTLFLLGHILGVLSSNAFRSYEPIKYRLVYSESRDNQGFMDSMAQDPMREDWPGEDSCPDFYFIANASRRIRQWINQKENMQAVGKILELLENNVKFLWHDTSEDKIAATVTFERLNTGKIALTDAELCRSLLLVNQNVEKELPQLKGFPENDRAVLLPRLRSALIDRRQIMQADNWDDGERLLHDEAFWAFLGIGGDIPTRMDYILQLHYDLYPEYKGHYVCFDKLFRELGKAESDEMADGYSAWGYLKQTIQQLWDWYNDSDYYHWIGYLNRNNRKHLPQLVKLARELTATDFRKEVLDRIRNSIGGGKLDLERIKYAPGLNTPCGQLLLLFNVEYARNRPNGFARFPFAQYSRDLSIEHISPRNPRNLESAAEIQDWLKERYNYLEGLKKSELEQIFASSSNADEEAGESSGEDAEAAVPKSVKDKAAEILKQKAELLGRIDALTEAFGKLKKDERVGGLVEQFTPLKEDYNDFMARIEDMEEDDVNRIYNLCLLDKNINTSFSNSEFCDKQRKLRVLLANGSEYVPPATQAVFMRHFMDKDPNCSWWSKNDRKAYNRMLCKTLSIFWPELIGTSEEVSSE